jgi:hypothetical protein
MAPEAIVEGKFTSASEVWSFGVFCWELLTMGEEPYPDLTGEGTLKAVLNGTRLPKPANCPDDLYAIATLIPAVCS